MPGSPHNGRNQPQRNPNQQPPKSGKGWLVAVFAATVVGMAVLSNNAEKQVPPIPYTEFIESVNNGKVVEIETQGRAITGTFNDTGEKFTTRMPVNENLFDRLPDMNNDGIPDIPDQDGDGNRDNLIITDKPEAGPNIMLSLLFTMAPIVLLGGLIYFMMRKSMGGGGISNIAKSNAKVQSEKDKKTFADVAGVDEAKEDVQEFVDFLKDPAKFTGLGAKMPKGILLVGEPGNGKTLLAKAVAGEAGVPFFAMSGSEFVEMFVGVGAARVRDLFKKARESAPCIVFIDEIDAIGRKRGAGMNMGHSENDQTLNQILVEMDGFGAEAGVIVMAATNRPDVLDPALKRPGRFNREVVVSPPDVYGRAEILKVHTRKMPLAQDVDLLEVARLTTPGTSGADLENIANEAAIQATREGESMVYKRHFVDACDRQLLGGRARKSMMIPEEEKRVTADHEAGHAIVAYYKEHSDPISKATILPRGQSLGHVMRVPEEGRIHYTKDKFLADLAVAMGGRAGELQMGRSESAGASGDIQQATNIARMMVTELGMSDLGMVLYGTGRQASFLGGTNGSMADLSEETKREIDKAVKKLIDGAFEDACSIIKEHADEHKRISDALMKHETLTFEEIKTIIEGGTIERAQLSSRNPTIENLLDKEKNKDRKGDDDVPPPPPGGQTPPPGLHPM